jgi:hypothetical protein
MSGYRWATDGCAACRVWAMRSQRWRAGWGRALRRNKNRVCDGAAQRCAHKDAAASTVHSDRPPVCVVASGGARPHPAPVIANPEGGGRIRVVARACSP